MDYIEKKQEGLECQDRLTMLPPNFYGVKDFINGQTSLNEIELTLLGDIKEKSIIHLQCHFGQDTISLGRMGGCYRNRG
jgi:hypothetical protein